MTDDVTHLRALLAEQTARAERAEAELAGVADAMHGPTIQPLAERVRGYVEACALFSAEKAEALAALAYAADRRGTQFDFDEWLPMVVAALGREPAPQPPHTNPRAEKAEAACAEMRALLEDAIEDTPCDHLDHHGVCQTHSMSSAPCAVAEARAALLSRTDLGRGWASPEMVRRVYDVLRATRDIGVAVEQINDLLCELAHLDDKQGGE